jgi:AraC-like DNA-binding protein
MESILHPAPDTLFPIHRYHPRQPLTTPFAETSSKVLTGSFGTILYQEIKGYYNTYRHYNCFIKQAARVPCFEMEDRPFFCVNMKHTIVLQFGNSPEYPFYEWASNILYHPAETGNVIFRKEGEYSFFTIHLDPDFLEMFAPSYPDVDRLLQGAAQKRPAVFNASNIPANMPMRNVISDLLYCNYSDQYYYVFLASKSQELLRPFFRQSQISFPVLTSVCEKEAEALCRVKEKLMAQLHLPHTLEELAQFAYLSEYKLKYGFRQVYGMGVFDFLHVARMKKAYGLVADTSLPYDEIATIVGYSSNTTFFNKFKKYAGISPKRLRDSVQGRGTRCCRRKS